MSSLTSRDDDDNDNCRAGLGGTQSHELSTPLPQVSSNSDVMVSAAVLHPGLYNSGLKNPAREKNCGLFPDENGFYRRAVNSSWCLNLENRIQLTAEFNDLL